MSVCPLDYRYGRNKVKNIFSEKGKLEKMLMVEAALAKAHAVVGNIPKKDAEWISHLANTEHVTLTRVKETEAKIKHDVMSIVRVLGEVSGVSGKYVHLGATSNDIIDTAEALQRKEFIDILEKDLIELEDVLISLSLKHKNTVMLGRTHGQYAVPITFGLKISVFLAEVHRHTIRLKEMKKRVLVGKMRGAVGTGAALGEKALEIEKIVMEELGLGMDEASTQIVTRDRLIEFVNLCSAISTSLEKFATEIRNLQRSEIGEVQEYFDVKKQVGSSTMSHKRNPIVSENICSLSRIVRGFVVPMNESANVWHERDLSNSAAERFIIPHMAVLIDDILIKMSNVFKNLIVNENRMLKNIEDTKGIIMAEAVMMHLTSKGMDRNEAHELLRQITMKMDDEESLRDSLLKNDKIKRLMGDEMDSVLDVKNYIGRAEDIIDNVVKIVKEDRERGVK
jgi:adenylosuccinate lyase